MYIFIDGYLENHIQIYSFLFMENQTKKTPATSTTKLEVREVLRDKKIMNETKEERGIFYYYFGSFFFFFVGGIGKTTPCIIPLAAGSHCLLHKGKRGKTSFLITPLQQTWNTLFFHIVCLFSDEHLHTYI